jgi:diguanylate cyclase (GGDEF)-like protein/PAS domain S-box-containing protein
LAPEHSEIIVQASIGIVTIGASYLFLRFKRLNLAGWTIVIFGWLILTLDLIFISGIRGVNVLGQVLIVMFAGLAINGKSALYITLINLLANLCVLLLERNGILANPSPLPANFTRWFIQTIYTSLAAIYIWRADHILKRSISQAQSAADQHRALFELTNDGVILLDLEWRILKANYQASVLLDYSLSELAELDFAAWFPATITDDIESIKDQLLDGREFPTFEHFLISCSGHEVPVDINMALVSDLDGNPKHIQMLLSDITDRKEYEKQLLYQALHDPLTSLPNRTYFENRYLLVQSQQEDDDKLVAVLYLDIDNFKSVNDQFGHSVGDQALMEFGSRLQAAIRESDTVARVGGDEFVIILENIHHKSNIENIADKILDRVSYPFDIDGNLIQISVSIGIDCAEKSKIGEVDLIKTSDKAMYQVKEDGKNNFRFFEDEE